MLNYPDLLEECIKAVRLAGQEILKFYGKPGKVIDKGNDSPLTQADLASNKILFKKLGKFNIPILSEEGTDNKKRLEADYVWIIDPLDGTKDFIQETGEFTVMVGLVEKQADGCYRPVIGLVYRPVDGVVYCAVKDRGAWARHDTGEVRDLSVSPESKWHNTVMFTSRNHTTDLERVIAKKLAIPKVVTYGSSLKACLIAEGEGHVNFNIAPFTWEWDVCATDLILHEAGGKLTDSKGNIITYNKNNPKNMNGYVATNGIIHKEIIKNIKELSK